MRSRFWPGVFALLLLPLVASAAGADDVWETYRSPFGTFRGLSVNAADGTVWVSSGRDVLHLGTDGQILRRIGGVDRPTAVSVNSTDGSCWIAATGASKVFHVSAEGEFLGGADNLPATALAASPVSGSCAVAVSATDAGKGVVLLAEDGTETWRHEMPAGVRALEASPADGAWWTADTNGDVIRLRPDGTEAWRQTLGATSISVNTADGSGWIATGTALVHLSGDGAELLRVSSDGPIDSASVDSSDGSVWIHTTAGVVEHLFTGAPGDAPSADGFSSAEGPPLAASAADGSCWVLAHPGLDWRSLVHLAGDCTRLGWQEALFPDDVSFSPAPSSGWVSYHQSWEPTPGSLGSVAHLAPDGTPLLQTDQYYGPIAVNPADGSVWLNGPGDQGWLLHLAADGTELLRTDPPTGRFFMAVDPTDGSCWTINGWGDLVGEHGWQWWGGIAHVAVDGSVLFSSSDGNVPRWRLAVNSTDGSVWLVEGGDTRELVHLSREGVELYRAPSDAASLSVDPGDGSVWAGGPGYVAHLAADGTQLWRDDNYGGAGASGEDPSSCAVAVNPWDHTCWIADRSQVVRVTAGGVVLSRTPGFDFTGSMRYAAAVLSVNPMDGSCWVIDVGNSQVVRLAPAEYPVQHFRDVPRDHWAFAEVEACVDVGIIQGFPNGTYRPDQVVTRDQMAVYLARALALPGGGAAVPTGPAGPTFADVDAEHWAYPYIEYCSAAGIVQGYPNGTYQPDAAVTRGQMAVYIARSQVTPSGDAALPDPPGVPTFPDVTPENDWSWCYPHVEYCAAEGIVQGYSDGYHPERDVTRDQMAVYIARAFALPM